VPHLNPAVDGVIRKMRSNSRCKGSLAKALSLVEELLDLDSETRISAKTMEDRLESIVAEAEEELRSLHH
jgi:hypothetical protein